MALTELAGLARRWADTVASGRTYVGTEKAIRRTRRMLATSTSRGDRAAFLHQLAMYENELAQLHTATFGPDPNEDENGRDYAESVASSAALLHALAGAESTTADWPPRKPARGDIEQAAGAILNQVADSPDLADRRALLQELHDAVAPVVGPLAAGALATLPSPGHLGWRQSPKGVAVNGTVDPQAREGRCVMAQQVFPCNTCRMGARIGSENGPYANPKCPSRQSKPKPGKKGVS